MPRARRKRRRRPTGGRGLNHAARTVGASAWSLFAGTVALVVAAVRAAGGGAWRWLARNDWRARGLAIGAVAVLCVALLFGYRHWTRGDDGDTDDGGPVYAATDTEALARVIRSEIGTGSLQQRLHVAWATRNLAEKRHTTVVRMACSPCGRQEAGRPVSTRFAPTDDDRKLAALVLAAPKLLDPTGGATHFIDPALQDELAASGAVDGYAGQTYQRVRRRWQARYGWEPYYRLGDDLEMWGPKRPQRQRRHVRRH